MSEYSKGDFAHSIPASLESLDLSSIPWENVESAKVDIAGGKITQRAELRINSEKTNLVLKIEKREHPNLEPTIYFNLTDGLSSGDKLLSGSIPFYRTNVYERRKFNQVKVGAWVNIYRDKDNPKSALIPAGADIVLYRKMLDYIEHEAVKQGGILHTETYDEDTGLTREEWDQTFVPILEERGYQKNADPEIAECEWLRLYEAAK